MCVDAIWGRDFKSHEHGGPKYGMEEEDFFSDDVVLRGPEVFSFCFGKCVVSETERGDVVEECIDPDVDDMIGIIGYGYSPFETGASHGDVLETFAEPAEHFVSAGLGSDEMRMLFV